MKLARIRVDHAQAALRVDADTAVETRARDVRELLSSPDWHARAESASGRIHDLSTVDYASLVPEPSPRVVRCTRARGAGWVSATTVRRFPYRAGGWWVRRGLPRVGCGVDPAAARSGQVARRRSRCAVCGAAHA